MAINRIGVEHGIYPEWSSGSPSKFYDPAPDYKREIARKAEEYTRQMMGSVGGLTWDEQVNVAWLDRNSWLPAWANKGGSYDTWNVAVSSPVMYGAPRTGPSYHATTYVVTFRLLVGYDVNAERRWFKIVALKDGLSLAAARLMMTGPIEDCPIPNTHDMGYRWGDSKQREAGMNYTTAIFLVNTDVRCVGVSYEPGPDGKPGAQVPFKTLDPAIKVGDYVIIPTDTRHLKTVGKVEAVDIDVDFDAGYQMKWIIDSVNTTNYTSVLEQEAAAIAVMKSAEKRSKREELAKKIMADNPELQGLAIVNKGAPTLAAPPVPPAAPEGS